MQFILTKTLLICVWHVNMIFCLGISYGEHNRYAALIRLPFSCIDIRDSVVPFWIWSNFTIRWDKWFNLSMWLDWIASECSTPSTNNDDDLSKSRLHWRLFQWSMYPRISHKGKFSRILFRTIKFKLKQTQQYSLQIINAAFSYYTVLHGLDR